MGFGHDQTVNPLESLNCVTKGQVRCAINKSIIALLVELFLSTVLEIKVTPCCSNNVL